MPYIFGGDTGITAEDLARQREMRRAQMQQAMEASAPSANPLAAITSMIQNAQQQGQGRFGGITSLRGRLGGVLGLGTRNATPAAPPAQGTQPSVPVGPAPSSPAGGARAAAGMQPTTGGSMAELASYIQAGATKRGMDPNIALAVARSEGLQPGVWQSNVVKNGRREPSYGPFQLYMGGGEGNRMQRATGLNPADPANVLPSIDWALDAAKRGGWGPWYGARTVPALRVNGRFNPWGGIR